MDLEIIYRERWYGEVPGGVLCRNCFGNAEWKEWFDKNAQIIEKPCALGCFFEDFKRVTIEQFVEHAVEILKENFKIADLKPEPLNKVDLADFIAGNYGLNIKLQKLLEEALIDLSWERVDLEEE